MDLNEAIEYALDGESILFVGAGFSKGATNICGENFLAGKGLAGHLSSSP